MVTLRSWSAPRLLASRLRIGAALGALSLLAGCLGGGGGGDDGFGPMSPRAVTPGLQQVALPISGRLEARVQVVDMPDKDLPVVPLGGAGPLALSVPAELEDRLLRIVISPVDERIEQHEDDFDTTQSSMPELAVLLATGRQLNQGGLGFNPLSDYIARRLDAFLYTTTDARLAFFQDSIAAEFIGHDLDGDGKVDYNDVMAFNPDDAEHLRRLKFDYPAVMHAPRSGGNSLRQQYLAQANDLDDTLFDALEPEEHYDLPGLDTMSVTLLHIDSNKGGTISIDGMNVRLDDTNGRLIQRDPISDAPATYTLRAHAEDTWRFVNWIGCDAVDAANACTVRMDASKDVAALFAIEENILADGIANVLRLKDFPDAAYLFNMVSDDTLVLQDVGDAALIQALASLTQDSVIATGRWREPMLKLLRAPDPAQAAGGGLYTFQFQVEPTEYLDVYQALSTFVGDEPISILEVSSAQVELYPEEDSSGPTVQAAARRTQSANAGADAQDNLVWMVGHGYAVDAGHGYYLLQNPDAPGFVLARAEGTVQEVPRGDLMKTMDGACALNSTAPECAVLETGRRSMAGKSSGCLILVGGCNIKVIEIKWTAKSWENSGKTASGKLGGTLSIEGNIDVNMAHSSMHFLWSAVPPALDFALNARGQATAAVGAKLFLGLDGKFVANKNIIMKGKEAYLKEQEEQANNPTRERSNAIVQQFPVDDPKFNNASVDKPLNIGGLEAAASAAVAPGPAAPPGAPASAAASDGVDLSGGRPRSNARAFIFDPHPQAETADNKAAGISLVLNRSTPDGAVMPLTLKLDLGVRGKGKLGVEATAGIEMRVPFEIDVDVGSNCRRERKLFVWMTNCSSGKKQRMEMHSKVHTYTTASLQAVANAEIEPYVELSLNYGPAGLKEDLIKISAGPSLAFNVIGNAGWSYSNHPEHKAQYAGVPDGCFRAQASFALSGDFLLKAEGKVDASIKRTFFGKAIGISLFELEIFKLKHKIPLFEPVVYKGGWPSVEDANACLSADERPARYFADEISWRPGELDWSEPNFVMTRTRKLLLTANGAFEIHSISRKDNGTGMVDKTKAMDWNKGPKTNTYPGARVAFQKDGNFVIYSLGEKPLWSSGTYRTGSVLNDMRLVLQRDGNLVIYENYSYQNGPRKAVWASDTTGPMMPG